MGRARAIGCRASRKRSIGERHAARPPDSSMRCQAQQVEAQQLDPPGFFPSMVAEAT